MKNNEIKQSLNFRLPYLSYFQRKKKTVLNWLERATDLLSNKICVMTHRHGTGVLLKEYCWIFPNYTNLAFHEKPLTRCTTAASCQVCPIVSISVCKHWPLATWQLLKLATSQSSRTWRHHSPFTKLRGLCWNLPSGHRIDRALRAGFSRDGELSRSLAWCE